MVSEKNGTLTYLRLGVAVRPELGRLSQQAASEPRAVPLPLVRDDLHLQATTPRTSAAYLTGADAVVDQVLDIPLQPAAKVLVQRATTREHDVLVQTTTNVDGAGLDNAVDHGGQGRQEVGAVDLRVEEDLGRQEALVAHVNGDLAAAGLEHGVLREACGIAVETAELLDNVRAHVAVLLLDLLGCLEGGVGLAAVTEEGLDEVCDVATGDGDRLDRRADDVSLGNGDDVGDTITGIDDSSGQRAILHLGGRPRCCKGEDGLHGDVETGAVEGLEEDLGCVFSVLGRVQGLGNGQPADAKSEGSV